MDSSFHRRLANSLRVLAMDGVQAANSGHPGMPMGMADVAVVLFRRFLKFSAAHPGWHDRDRFILSAGHGSMLLYGLLHLCGYADFPLSQLQTFRRLHSRAAGHPEYGHGGGIETTTGPLGQGFANAVGMALGEQLLRHQFGKDICDHRTWTVVGDGCLMEGISHEAASLAGHLRLDKLTVLFDDNKISIDGKTSLAQSDDTLARFAAYGFFTAACDGHDPANIAAAIKNALSAQKPAFIACRTIIGYGAPSKQNTAAAHGAPLGREEVAAARKELAWEHPPFDIPADIKTEWENIGRRGDAQQAAWQKRLNSRDDAAEIINRLQGQLPPGWDSALQKWQAEIVQKKPAMATRQAGGDSLARLAPALPALIGGSADLTGSNNTHVGQQAISAEQKNGAYIHYGVREHAMAAAMNGLALHGGFIPYGGTFLVFSDYCRPAIRLSALMRAKVVYVMTHDSIGLGEDGPTHQPVEHLAALRAIPNLRVWRPCDALETAECWRLSLLQNGPSLLALSRQSLPTITAAVDIKNFCNRGGYLLAGGGFPPNNSATNSTTNSTANSAPKIELTIAASGAEVSLALAARDLLAAENIRAAVVSVPCLELFCEQSQSYLQKTVAADKPLLIVEAAAAMPWYVLSPRVCKIAFHCMKTFGVSAPAKDAFAHFGFTAENIADKARQLTGK